MCFFKVKHYFGHISEMVGPIDVKRKGTALVGYWVQYVTLTFDLLHDHDLGCFKVKFRNSSICRIVGLIDVKWKGSELIWCWANCMTLPLDHTHDLDLGVSRSESEIALSQEWGSLLTMNEKDASHPFMTMILTCVTMVGWADVPDSDRGDFRRRRAVDISSLGHTHRLLYFFFATVMWYSFQIIVWFTENTMVLSVCHRYIQSSKYQKLYSICLLWKNVLLSTIYIQTACGNDWYCEYFFLYCEIWGETHFIYEIILINWGCFCSGVFFLGRMILTCSSQWWELIEKNKNI